MGIISIFTTVLMIIVFFLSGKIFESIKRLLALAVSIFLKLLKLFGINIEKHEHPVKVSNKFKSVFQDIKIVKKSNQNFKMKKSVNMVAFLLMIISIALIIINLQVVSDNIISKWLFKHNIMPHLILSQSNMDVTFTAVVFSILSFAATTFFRQILDTREYRKARRQIKQRQLLLKDISSRELLNITKSKDKLNYDELINKSTQEDENA